MKDSTHFATPPPQLCVMCSVTGFCPCRKSLRAAFHAGVPGPWSSRNQWSSRCLSNPQAMGAGVHAARAPFRQKARGSGHAGICSPRATAFRRLPSAGSRRFPWICPARPMLRPLPPKTARNAPASCPIPSVRPDRAGLPVLPVSRFRHEPRRAACRPENGFSSVTALLRAVNTTALPSP